MSKENILIGDAYFIANPSHVLGDPYEKARGDRGGQIEHMVKGTLDSAVEKFEALQNASKVNISASETEDCEKVITPIYIARVLQTDSYYDPNMNFQKVSLNAFLVYDLVKEYTKEKPLLTSFSENAYFSPDERMIIRDGLCPSWAKYTAHFVTTGTPRKEDKSKMIAIEHIIDVLKTSTNRYEQKNKDNSTTIHYTKSTEINLPFENYVVTLKVDLSREKLIKGITILPNQKDKQIQKKLAEGIWIPTANFFQLSDTTSSIGNNKSQSEDFVLSTSASDTNLRNFEDFDAIRRKIILEALQFILYYNQGQIKDDRKMKEAILDLIKALSIPTTQPTTTMNEQPTYSITNKMVQSKSSIEPIKMIAEEYVNVEAIKNLEKALSKAETDRKKTVVTAVASKNSNGEIADSLMYSAEENYNILNPEITAEELSAFLHANPQSHIWEFKKPIISEEECFKKGLLMLDVPSYLNLGAIKTVYVHEYLSGNVFKKMNAVQNAISKNWPNDEANKNKYFTLSQLEFQLAKMQTILPPFKRVDAVDEKDRIILLPHAQVCKKLIITQLKNGSSTGDKSLYELYLGYVIKSLRASQITNGANLEDIQRYVANKSIRLTEYERKNLSDDQVSELKQNKQVRAKEMADKLFYDFIEKFINQQDIAILNQEWNSKFNGSVEPQLAKIPVSFPFSKIFKGGSKLALTTTQRNGAAFDQLNGSSLLGYDVGVGKTLTLIACLSNQFATGTTKRALLVVPDATYKKWIFEIKGGEDKNKKWVYGALPTANVFAYGNLNKDVIENEVREYSEKEQKQIAFLKNSIEKCTLFNKLIASSTFNEDAFQKPLKEFISSLQKFDGASEFLLKNALASDRVRAALMINEKNNSFAASFIELILDTLKQDLELAIYTLGKVKPIPEGSIVMLNYTGLVRLGFSEDSRIKLRDGLYKILSQGEIDAKNEASLVKKIDEIIGTTGLNAKINIDDLQIDHLAIDEAHNMKKVFTRVKGEVKAGNEVDEKGFVKRENSQYALDSGEPSNQAICAFCMSQYVQEIAKGNCTILTATPFTNNPLEVFSILALTNYRRLKDEDKDNMLDFFNTYIKEEMQLVINAKGLPEYKPVVTGFNNLPQLRQMIFDIIDYKTGEDANVMRPEAISIPDTSSTKKWNGVTSMLQMTPLQKSYMKKIEEYINSKEATVFDVCNDAFDNEEACELTKEYEKNLENAKSDLYDEAEATKVLRGLSWQKLLAVSPYLFACNDLKCPTYKDFIEDSPKLLYTIKCIESSKKWHEARKESVSGSVIYMSAGTRYFPLIKEYLIKETGFAKDEVELIYGEISPTKKEKIKEDFLEGKVKVVIGSGTIKEGIDLQNKSTSLYIIIPDWNPTDYNQVKGRIWRQGNEFSYVRIVNVLMANTADVFIYQKLQEKTQRIKELLDKASTKSQLDLDDVNPEEIKENLITDPMKKALIQIKRQSREIDAQITVVNNQILRLVDLQSATTTFNNLHPKVVNSVNEFNQKYAQILKERDQEEDRAKRESHEAKGIDKEFVSKFDPNNEIYIPITFDVNDYSEQNIAAINRRATSMIQRVKDAEVFITGFNYYVLQELVSNWREVRARFLKGLETLASMGFTNEQLNQAIESNQEKVKTLQTEKENLYSEDYLKNLVSQNQIEIDNREAGVLSLEELVSQFASLNDYMQYKSTFAKPVELPKEVEIENTIDGKEEVQVVEFKEEDLAKKPITSEIDTQIIDKITKVKEKKATKKQQLKLRLELLKEMFEDSKDAKLELRIELLEEMLEVA